MALDVGAHPGGGDGVEDQFRDEVLQVIGQLAFALDPRRKGGLRAIDAGDDVEPQGMEGVDPDFDAQPLADACAHLLGGIAVEGQQQDFIGSAEALAH